MMNVSKKLFMAMNLCSLLFPLSGLAANLDITLENTTATVTASDDGSAVLLSPMAPWTASQSISSFSTVPNPDDTSSCGIPGNWQQYAQISGEVEQPYVSGSGSGSSYSYQQMCNSSTGYTEYASVPPIPPQAKVAETPEGAVGIPMGVSTFGGDSSTAPVISGGLAIGYAKADSGDQSHRNYITPLAFDSSANHTVLLDGSLANGYQQFFDSSNWTSDGCEVTANVDSTGLTPQIIARRSTFLTFAYSDGMEVTVSHAQGMLGAENPTNVAACTTSSADYCMPVGYKTYSNIYWTLPTSGWAVSIKNATRGHDGASFKLSCPTGNSSYGMTESYNVTMHITIPVTCAVSVPSVVDLGRVTNPVGATGTLPVSVSCNGPEHDSQSAGTLPSWSDQFRIAVVSPTNDYVSCGSSSWEQCIPFKDQNGNNDTMFDVEASGGSVILGSDGYIHSRGVLPDITDENGGNLTESYTLIVMANKDNATPTIGLHSATATLRVYYN